jgi:UDP-N-acetyl-D-mannosaminuronate dehydrogenase
LATTLGIAPEKRSHHVAGVAYKNNVNDLRDSPALTIIELLQKKDVPAKRSGSPLSMSVIRTTLGSAARWNGFEAVRER